MGKIQGRGEMRQFPKLGNFLLIYARFSGMIQENSNDMEETNHGL